MRIERWEPGDEAAVGACHEVWRAARETDDPFGSPKSAHVLGAWLKRGFQGHLGEVWLARDAPGAAIVAWYRLSLPGRENRESAGLYLIVHPDHRRHGIGTALLTQLVRANPDHSTISVSFVAGKPVLRLYERFGFKVVEQRPDAVVMHRPA